MPFPLSCPPSTAFLQTLRSSVSATAAFSIEGQSWSSYSVHACAASSLKGSYATGRITSPGAEEMMSVRPSRALSSILKPHSASVSEIDRSMYRSSPCRLNSACGCSLRTKTTSPASPSGISSAFSEKLILCWSGAPLGMWTSRVSCCLDWRNVCPVPPHTSHVFCTCWIIGPIRIVWIRAPCPWHAEQVSTPRWRSITFRVSRSERVAPLYSCSSVTLRGCTIGSPFLTRLCCRPPRPRPERTSKISPGPPPPPPSSSPSSPYRSYSSRFLSSPSASWAFWMFLKTSGSPPLSGWFLTAALRYAFLISSCVAVLDTPSSL
mmetsp:Transcript_21554/g.71279  ORF Transcript_21554/g.71279 Transcript_21554/m.71279 type:complete len:321 (-) Transcript_21554:173-1135(-)